MGLGMSEVGEWARAAMGAVGAASAAVGAALFRLTNRQGRMEERLLDIEEDLKTTETVLPSIWESIKNVEVTVVRLEERQVSGNRQIYTHLEHLANEFDKRKD